MIPNRGRTRELPTRIRNIADALIGLYYTLCPIGRISIPPLPGEFPKPPSKTQHMPIIRLSGTVLHDQDPARELRADLLALLFRAGWNIFNSNGDQRITLGNIESKIIESNAFLFTPQPTLEDMFKAISIFVGYQTLDPNLLGKPTIILNGDGSWTGFFGVLSELHRQGTIRQNHEDFLQQAVSIDDVLPMLKRSSQSPPPDAGRARCFPDRATSFETPMPDGLHGNACVFCSASIHDPAYLADGYELGRRLAENQFGCISGAGKSGIMGTVVQGSVDAGGWTAGSNVPHIIELEGLPDGLSTFWLRPDIYTRMEVMIQNSNAFVILPGGSGTMQELLALLIFRSKNDPMMENKPIVIYNRPLPDGTRFWDSLVELLHRHGRGGDCVVVERVADIVPALLPQLAPEPALA